MKKLGIYAVITATSLIALTGCKNNDDNDNWEEDYGTRIRLSSKVELGAQRELQDLQIVQGQALSFFVTTAGDENDVLYSNREITADGIGGFEYNPAMYYPENGDNVDFYAVHPYVGNATLGESIEFMIENNQSSREGYLNSDLLYATQTNVERQRSAVPLEFQHKLAKLDFIIIQGEGSDISDLSAVTALAVQPSVNLNTLLGTLSSASGTPTEVFTYGVTAPTQGATQVSGITAIIPPQTFTAGERLFRIRLGEFDYYYTPTANTAFLAGNRYTLRLTINQAAIELESTIAPWTNGGIIEGEGTID